MQSAYGIPIDLIRREAFFNVESPGSYLRQLIFLIAVFALVFFIQNLIKYVKRWQQGKEELRTDFPEKRLKLLVSKVLLQSTLLKDKYAGIMHCLMFIGMTGLFIICLINAFEQNLTGPVFGNFFIHGYFYLWLSLIADICGLMIFMGLVLAIIRRYISKPTRLSRTRGYTFMLIFLLFMVLTGFVNEGLRIAVSDYPDFERWSFVGWIFAKPFSFIHYHTVSYIQQVMWFVHAAAGLSFIALLASGKLKHIIISPINIYFSNLLNADLHSKYTVPLIKDIQTVPDTSHTKDLSWKARLDCDACVECGRCQDNCPVWLSKNTLSPKLFIKKMKESILAERQDPDQKLSIDHQWACTNCAACMEECPALIEHLPKILDIRRNKVLVSNEIPDKIRILFENSEKSMLRQDNKFISWNDSLKALGVAHIQENADVDYLYFCGSAVREDESARNEAECFLRIMQTAGIKIAVLGDEEADSGDAALRCGNEYLFRTLAVKNIETFSRYGIKRIVCTSPHEYNILKKEYAYLTKNKNMFNNELPAYNVQVFHYSEIILDILKRKLVLLTTPLYETVVYHDPCFLGRYNKIYNIPRNVLHFIPGLRLVEMERNLEHSFCCGSGGGTVFSHDGSEISLKAFRAKEAQFSGANILCTACPFCKKMLSEGVAEMGLINIRVADIAELVYNSMVSS